MASIPADVTAPREMTKERSSDSLVQWVIFILTLGLVIFPAWPILLQSVMDKPLYDAGRAFTLTNFSHVLTDPDFWGVLGRTAEFAILATVVSVAIGAGLALLFSRTDLPLRGTMSSLILVPFYISPLVLALASSVMFGPQGYVTLLVRKIGLPTWDLYSIGGMVLVAVIYYVPYVFLYCRSSLALSDPQLEDAARIAGAGPFPTLWHVTVPLLRPALMYSSLLVLVSSIEILSIPLVIGTPTNINVLSTYLYTLGIVGTRTDYGAIAVVSIFTVILVTLLVFMQGRLMRQERRFVTVGGKATRPRVIRLGAWKWPTFAAVLVLLTLGVLVPLAGIVAQSFTAFLSPFVNPLDVLTLDNYRTVLEVEAYRQSIINSLLIGLVGGLVAIIYMALVAVTAYRSDFPGRRFLSYIAMYPRAFPGIIVGIGFLWAFLLIPGIGAIRNTILVLVIAFSMRHLPLGFSSVSPSVLRVSPELDRAARVSGATWLGTVRHILLPILRPSLFAGYVLLFVTFLKEYAVALFLFARGSQVIGTTMIELWRQGDSGPVAALATIQIVLTMLAVFIGTRLLGVSLHE